MKYFKTIILIFILAFITSCNAQEIRVEYNSEYGNQIKIFKLFQNDTIVINENSPKYYPLKEITENTILIEYNHKIFKLENLNEEVRGVFIDFDPNSENNCYVVHTSFSDAIQTSSQDVLKDCSAITNIYLYRDLKFDINKPQSVKFRK